MAKKYCVKSRFSLDYGVETGRRCFLDCGFDLPVDADPMVDPVTSMRRKPWSDTGFLD